MQSGKLKSRVAYDYFWNVMIQHRFNIRNNNTTPKHLFGCVCSHSQTQLLLKILFHQCFTLHVMHIELYFLINK